MEMWDRLRARIKAMPDGDGREQAWLAEKLELRVQVVNNWLQRGVIPPSRFEAIADAVGWQLNELLGRAAPAPLPGVLRRDIQARLQRLSERELGRLELVIEQELDRLAAPAQSQTSVSPTKTAA